MVEGILTIKESENVPAKEAQSHKKTDGARQNDPILTVDANKSEKDVGLKEAVEQIESAANFLDRKLRLEIEKDLNIMVVKIIDRKTEEVIRQIPPEELIELSKHAKDLKGLLIDKEV